ncbi:uncharacterized protein LOC126989144 [Eriocheir sinensis]|uniref:uncharacterized protein LOC126989144 n=1 Tax=Eriocheir sinensis TaxID=95602 RepID=UPI0021C5A991|nr:uncharacterized protein LOC126989144 [Eriocheir sinensis]
MLTFLGLLQSLTRHLSQAPSFTLDHPWRRTPWSLPRSTGMLTSMRLYTIMNQLVKGWSLLQAPLCDSTAGEPTQDQKVMNQLVKGWSLLRAPLCDSTAGEPTQDQKVDEGNLESQHQTLAPPPPRPGSLPQGPWSHQRYLVFSLLIGSSEARGRCQPGQAPRDNVALEYSSNNGQTWAALQRLEPQHTTRRKEPFFVPLPPAARTRHTRFRWWQAPGDMLLADEPFPENCAMYGRP